MESSVGGGLGENIKQGIRSPVGVEKHMACNGTHVDLKFVNIAGGGGGRGQISHRHRVSEVLRNLIASFSFAGATLELRSIGERHAHSC